jgi:hypothetical protein
VPPSRSPTSWYADGGCNFWHDPARNGEETLIFWHPELLVDIVYLAPDPTSADAVRFEPWRWPGRKAAFATADSFHMIVADGPAEYRLWLPGAEPPPIGTPLAARINLDGDARHHANAALRFCAMARADRGRRQSRSRPVRPDYPILRQARMLQAFDGRRAGATYRAIAVAIFGEKAIAEAQPWKTSTLRSTVITLAENATALIEGGYRNLLRPRETGFRIDP